MVGLNIEKVCPIGVHKLIPHENEKVRSIFTKSFCRGKVGEYSQIDLIQFFKNKKVNTTKY